MHPAKSVIFFTTASGAGYGLAFLLILFSILGILPTSAGLGWAGFLIAGALVTAGLLSSTLHLGHPERAWRALTQWRSSWLSREGVMAVLTYPPVILYAAGWVFGADLTNPLWVVIGLIACLFSAVTVFCTAMIYASLKPVHAWANPLVPVGYSLFAVMTGAVLLSFLARLSGISPIAPEVAALITLALGYGLKSAYWARMEDKPAPSTMETATGLGTIGKVSLLEAPHSEANYLMHEMVFKIARKHAQKLRMVVVGGGFALPFLCLGAAVLTGPVSGLGTGLVGLAVLFTAVGIYTERWLFFAEARHTVGLYYGSGSA